MPFSRTSSLSERLIDRGFRATTLFAGWAVAAGLAIVVLQVVRAAGPAFQTLGVSPIFSADWDPNPDHEKFGLLPAIAGTILTSLFALLLAGFVGILFAVFLNERFIGKRPAMVFTILVDLLAAVPSVIFGLWGIEVVAPPIQILGGWFHEHFGSIPLFGTAPGSRSILASSIVLALMVLPTVASVSCEALAAVPMALRQASFALGATKWETIWRVVLPTALPGIVGALLLGLGRAIGETMAVTMLIGNKPELTWSIFSPASTLTTLLANQIHEATDVQASVLMQAALVLMVLTLGLNILGVQLGQGFAKSLRGHRP